MDFIDNRDTTTDRDFKSNNEREDDNDLEIKHCEEKCLTEGVFNAYKAYETGVYQVGSI